MAAFLYADTIPVDRSRREIGIDLANFLKCGLHFPIVAGINPPGYTAIAFPAIQPVAHAA